MVHLVVHLVDKVKADDPMHYRWMYPMERYLGILKSYVRNKAQPEGSIVEGYLAEEILTFCSRYLENIETRINQPVHVDDEPKDANHQGKDIMFPKVGRPIANDGAQHSNELRWLAHGPLDQDK